MSVKLDWTNPTFVRRKLKLSPYCGDFGSKKYKRECGCLCGVAESGVRWLLYWCVWQEDVFTFNLLKLYNVFTSSAIRKGNFEKNALPVHKTVLYQSNLTGYTLG
jgi:hypothetical protein